MCFTTNASTGSLKSKLHSGAITTPKSAQHANKQTPLFMDDYMHRLGNALVGASGSSGIDHNASDGGIGSSLEPHPS